MRASFGTEANTLGLSVGHDEALGGECRYDALHRGARQAGGTGDLGKAEAGGLSSQRAQNGGGARDQAHVAARRPVRFERVHRRSAHA